MAKPQLVVEEKVQHLESLAEQLHKELSALRGSFYDNPHANVSDLFVHANGTLGVAGNANELSGARDQRPILYNLGDSRETGRKVDYLQVPSAHVGVNDGTGTGTGTTGMVASKDVGKAQTDSTDLGIRALMQRDPTRTTGCLSSLHWRDVLNVVGGVVIVSHIVCIGFTTEYSLQGRESQILHILENLFLGYYIMEMFIFLFVDGWRTSFHDRWFCFDVLLVGIAILSQWLFPLLVYLTTGSGEVIGLEKALIIRILRLGRLLRALRVIESFADLWKLVAGIIRSTRTVLSACVLIVIILYVFALVGVEVVRKDQKLLDDETTRELVLGHFDSVFGVFLTLVQFANADSIAGLYDPVIRVQPVLALYFGAVWIVVTILLMNLVTAVVIQNAIDMGAEDAEATSREKKKRLQRMVPLLKDAFKAVDRSSDGKLQIDEIELLCNLNLPRELKKIMEKDRMKDLFRRLDSDETGDVSMEEFVKGICQIALSDVPIETTQMLSMLRVQGKVLDQLRRSFSEKAPPPPPGLQPFGPRAALGAPLLTSLGGRAR
jgi:hypothetical protein